MDIFVRFYFDWDLLMAVAGQFGLPDRPDYAFLLKTRLQCLKKIGR
jgi:hypothetical protein